MSDASDDENMEDSPHWFSGSTIIQSIRSSEPLHPIPTFDEPPKPVTRTTNGDMEELARQVALSLVRIIYNFF